MRATEKTQLQQFYDHHATFVSRRALERFETATEMARKAWFATITSGQSHITAGIQEPGTGSAAGRLAALKSPAQRGWAWQPYLECADVVAGGCEACRQAGCGWCEQDGVCIFPLRSGCPTGHVPPIHPLQPAGCPAQPHR